MRDVLHLMREHRSVRSFTKEQIPEEDLRAILEAGQAASSWKNFQSYSIIVIRSREKKAALYALLKQESVRESSVFLLFVGDLNRAEKATRLHSETFYPEGEENLLITSVDASLVGQNVLLAAESLGYGGVFVGLVRHHGQEIADLVGLPDYTYPIFGMSLGRPAEKNEVKPRLPYEQVVFDETYQVSDSSFVEKYDQVQKEFAAQRYSNDWSERVAAQFYRPAHPATQELLENKKLRIKKIEE